MTQAVDSTDGTLAPRYADGVVCKESNAKSFLGGRKMEVNREAIRRGASARGSQDPLHNGLGMLRVSFNQGGR